MICNALQKVTAARYYVEDREKYHIPKMSIMLLDDSMDPLINPYHILGPLAELLEYHFCVTLIDMPWEIGVDILGHHEGYEKTEHKIVEFLAKELKLVCVEKVLTTGVVQRILVNQDNRNVFEN